MRNMLDLREIKKRYFEVITDDGIKLEIRPPKIKTLKKIIAVMNTEGNDKIVNSFIEALVLALSNNKENRKITAAFVEDKFDFDEICALLIQYIKWTNEIQNDPN